MHFLINFKLFELISSGKRHNDAMINNVFSYFLCAVVAAAGFASGPIHIYRDCCEKSFVFNQLDIKGCTSTQENNTFKGGCCSPLMSHTLALTAESPHLLNAKQLATSDVQCVLPDSRSATNTTQYSFSGRYDYSPHSVVRLPLYQRFSRLLI